MKRNKGPPLANDDSAGLLKVFYASHFLCETVCVTVWKWRNKDCFTYYMHRHMQKSKNNLHIASPVFSKNKDHTTVHSFWMFSSQNFLYLM